MAFEDDRIGGEEDDTSELESPAEVVGEDIELVGDGVEEVLELALEEGPDTEVSVDVDTVFVCDLLELSVMLVELSVLGEEDDGVEEVPPNAHPLARGMLGP